MNLNLSISMNSMKSYLNRRETLLYSGMVFQRNYLYQRLANENRKLLSFQEFQRKYDFRTNFLNFYQVINAIPKALVIKACTYSRQTS